jgi:hypothetical protein
MHCRSKAQHGRYAARRCARRVCLAIRDRANAKRRKFRVPDAAHPPPPPPPREPDLVCSPARSRSRSVDSDDAAAASPAARPRPRASPRPPSPARDVSRQAHRARKKAKQRQ